MRFLPFFVIAPKEVDSRSHRRSRSRYGLWLRLLVSGYTIWLVTFEHVPSTHGCSTIVGMASTFLPVSDNLRRCEERIVTQGIVALSGVDVMTERTSRREGILKLKAELDQTWTYNFRAIIKSIWRERIFADIRFGVVAVWTCYCNPLF